MKKGMFFSVISIILLIGFSLYLGVLERRDREAEEIDIIRTKIRSVGYFMHDFESYYVPKLLETSAMHALVARTNADVSTITDEELILIMKTGTYNGQTYIPSDLTTDTGLAQVLRTIPYRFEEHSFSYAIDDIRQPDYDTIEIEFLVDYSFEILNAKWMGQDRQFTVILKVYSMWHPAYQDIITQSWIPDSECYIDKILDNAGYCSEGIRPLVIPPPE
jgi:hypothetical protein